MGADSLMMRLHVCRPGLRRKLRGLRREGAGLYRLAREEFRLPWWRAAWGAFRLAGYEIHMVPEIPNNFWGPQKFGLLDALRGWTRNR